MSWLLIALVVIAVLVLAGRLALRAYFRKLVRQVKDDPEYQAGMARLQESYAAEATVREEAAWFGTTGLPEDVERELPKYLRREFGELLLEEGALKAGDLTYVGRFVEEGDTVHYWRIPPREGDEAFAYVEVDADGDLCTGWGDREPPAARAADRPSGPA